MNESNNNPPLNALKEFIVEHTNKAFEKGRTGLLLSQIGTLIAKESPQLRNSLGSRKLADFIAEEMAYTIKIVSHPEDSKLRIALPATEQANDNIMSFFPKRNATSSAKDIPRYNRVFWAAFSQPLSEGYTRSIEFKPELRFEDIMGVPSATNTNKTISSDFILNQASNTGSSPAQRSLQIATNIKKWLLENGVPLDLVIAQNVDSRVTGSHKESLLEILMEALDESELKRIQIPLDIAAKLHRKR